MAFLYHHILQYTYKVLIYRDDDVTQLKSTNYLSEKAEFDLNFSGSRG